MSETRKLTVADAVGYSRLAGADKERILARLRSLRNALIDPAITAHHGRIVKRTGDEAQSNSAAWRRPRRTVRLSHNSTSIVTARFHRAR